MGPYMKTRICPSHFILAGIPLLFLGIFYFYPLLNILKMSLAPEGEWDFRTAIAPDSFRILCQNPLVHLLAGSALHDSDPGFGASCRLGLYPV